MAVARILVEGVQDQMEQLILGRQVPDLLLRDDSADQAIPRAGIKGRVAAPRRSPVGRICQPGVEFNIDPQHGFLCRTSRPAQDRGLQRVRGLCFRHQHIEIPHRAQARLAVNVEGQKSPPQENGWNLVLAHDALNARDFGLQLGRTPRVFLEIGGNSIDKRLRHACRNRVVAEPPVQ